jgi:putative ABC transport system permease protein
MRRYRRLFDLRLGGRRRIDADMDREIDAHLEMRVEELVRGGMSERAARDEAHRRFGDVDSARRRLHAAARHREATMHQRDRIGGIVADVRQAARQARRAPGFTALAVAALALGIGSTTMVFTLVDRVLLRPLPFPHPEQLVTLAGLDSTHNSVTVVSSADWFDWRKATTVQSSALYSFPYRQGIVTTDSAARVSAQRVTGDFFSVLGARFAVGRPFVHDEVEAFTPVVVISERLWRRKFAADPRLTVPLRTPLRSYTIVGVVADGQDFPANTDVWFPVALTPQSDPIRVNVNWLLVARLRAGETVERSSRELTTIAQGIRASDPTALYDFGVGVEPLRDTIAGDVSDYLGLLMAAVAFVLLIVCANVAAAGLARGAARGREMAVRTSLGASRWRLVQQLLIEHLWLGLVGGGIGLFGAWIGVRVILAHWGGQIPRSNEVSIDGTVFAFSLGVSLFAGVLAGIAPALRVTRVSLNATLSSGGRGSAKGGRNLAGASLVTLEIAAALLLLTGAGLLVRSFRSVLERDIGFDTNVATAEVVLTGPRYARDSVRQYMYWDALIDAYRGIPGVQAVGLANSIPLGITGQSFVDVRGRQAGTTAGAMYRTVSRDFFRALQMPLLVGRTFDEQDGVMTERVVVINHLMAARDWPNQNPVGQYIRARGMESGPHGQPAPWLRIIGVVGDVRTFGLESEPRAEIYVFFRQTPDRVTGMTALVRASGPLSGVLDAMRRSARSIDPLLAADVGTLDARLRGTLATRRLTMALLSWFAATAVLLAALGIYGVLSYAVAQRTRELAVRSALGAQRVDLLRLVFAAGLRVVAAGMVLGAAGSLAAGRLISSMLVGVTPSDPMTYGAASGAILLVCMAAIYIPARRATRLEPAIALQGE